MTNKHEISDVYDLVNSVIEHVKTGDSTEQDIIQQITQLVQHQLQQSRLQSPTKPEALQKKSHELGQRKSLEISDLDKYSPQNLDNLMVTVFFLQLITLQQSSPQARVALKSSTIIRSVLNSSEIEDTKGPNEKTNEEEENVTDPTNTLTISYV